MAPSRRVADSDQNVKPYYSKLLSHPIAVTHVCHVAY